MPLSARERRVLAEIEDQLTQQDPELADLLGSRPLPPVVGRWRVLSPARFGLLVAVLVALVLVHPLVARWGATGLGLLTVGLVVPWVVTAARSGVRRQREPDPVDHDVDPTTRSATRTGRDDRPPRARWASLPIGLTVWAVVVALLEASGVGFADAALITTAVVLLIGVQVARCLARRALIRRFGSDGSDAHRRRPRADG